MGKGLFYFFDVFEFWQCPQRKMMGKVFFFLKFKKIKPKKTSNFSFVFLLLFEFPGWPIKGFARRTYGFRIWGNFPPRMT